MSALDVRPDERWYINQRVAGFGEPDSKPSRFNIHSGRVTMLSRYSVFVRFDDARCVSFDPTGRPHETEEEHTLRIVPWQPRFDTIMKSKEAFDAALELVQLLSAASGPVRVVERRHAAALAHIQSALTIVKGQTSEVADGSS